MLEVLNGASGRSAATSDKFPNHVLTGRYASGFTNSLMAKDVQLYLRAVTEQAGPPDRRGDGLGVGRFATLTPAPTSPASIPSSHRRNDEPSPRSR